MILLVSLVCDRAASRLVSRLQLLVDVQALTPVEDRAAVRAVSRPESPVVVRLRCRVAVRQCVLVVSLRISQAASQV